ncbi:hypothetical protein [Paenarthrobacter ureafaciens]|uniref:hypothetical protein n=1 Tax=Paenarthrobacter ureafaciens TaxID=37931 RepID=UPI001FB478BB|nr:hypothetical protein [Paenarthrobacter ureafaciens]UOD80333.1 hypothetical protein MQZ73_14590 [Paenarthrobacter ureafaciens]WNZ02986.1 hypothetical protein PVT25_15230 [Paenarthrobacter ureafaciens]
MSQERIEGRAAGLNEAAAVLASEEREQWRLDQRGIPCAQVVAQRMQVVRKVILSLDAQKPTPVVFSDEAIERAAEELWDGADPDVQWDHISDYLKERTRVRARAVVAALKGEQ